MRHWLRLVMGEAPAMRICAFLSRHRGFGMGLIGFVSGRGAVVGSFCRTEDLVARGCARLRWVAPGCADAGAARSICDSIGQDTMTTLPCSVKNQPVSIPN